MQKIKHLQVLRCIAASMVVIAHALQSLVRHALLDKQYDDIAWFFAWVGVTTFFIISGLILIRTSWTKFQMPYASYVFMMRRIIRIVPLYWFATLIFGVGMVLRGLPLIPEQVLKSLSFIPYTSSEVPLIRPIAGQGWTLDYEMWFYAMFATCLLLPRRFGVALLIAVPIILVVLGTAIRPLFPFHDAATPLEFWTDPIVLAFSIGITIGVLESRSARWHHFTHPIAGTLLVFGAAFAVSQIILPGYRLPIYGISCAVAVLLCTSAKVDEGGRISRIFEAGGDASFSTYLFHPIIITVLGAVAAKVPILFRSPMLFIVLSVVGANLLGYISYSLLEAKLNILLRPLTQFKFAPATSRQLLEK